MCGTEYNSVPASGRNETFRFKVKPLNRMRPHPCPSPKRRGVCPSPFRRRIQDEVCFGNLACYTITMFANLDPMFLLAIVVAVTVHEFSHAAAADYLGDPTPRLQGRLTLNPLAHLDLMGSIMFLLVRFGWGKPVMFDPYNLQNPKRDAALISFAGPASNLLTAGILALIIRLPLLSLSEVIGAALLPFFLQLIWISVALAIFNLIPIHPLDGGKILIGFLPNDKAADVDVFLQRYGVFILIFLLFTGSFSMIIGPVIRFVLGILLPGGGVV